MSENNFGSDGNEGECRQPGSCNSAPYWKRMHHSWLFWVGMAMVSVAIAIYVLSDNLALLPSGQTRPAVSEAGGR